MFRLIAMFETGNSFFYQEGPVVIRRGRGGASLAGVGGGIAG